MQDDTIDYYWVAASPWTYLGHDRLLELARRHGARVNLKPFDLGRDVEEFRRKGAAPE